MTSTHRGDRRRKLLRDESRASGTASESPTARRPAARRIYSDGALESRQPRITDFLPRRRRSLVVIFFLGTLVPVAILAAHVFLPRWIRHPAVLKVAPQISTYQTGTLESWWTSLSFLVSASLCALVFHLRRFKLDDYRGQYRMWLWAALLLILASLDVTTDIRREVGDVLTHSGRAWLVDLAKWWPYGWFVLLGGVGLRAWWDTRSSRVACALGLLCGTSYAMGALLACGTWPSVSAALRPLLIFIAYQMGHHLLAFSLFTYARHIFFLAQGSRVRRSRERTPAGKGTVARHSTVNSRTTSGGDLDQDSYSEELGQRNPDRLPKEGSAGTGYGHEALSPTERRRREKELRRQQRRAA